MEVISRPAVRVICLDGSSRVLLLCWRDPISAALLWEPPGGGIEPGETPFAAAQRELVEETGLDPAKVGPTMLVVARDVIWNGHRFIGPEQFYLARFAGDRPEVSLAGMTEAERAALVEYAWLTVAEIDHLIGAGEQVEPPQLLAVIADFDRGQALSR